MELTCINDQDWGNPGGRGGGGGGEEEGASGIKLNGHCHYELSLIYQLSICGHFKPHIIFSIKKI